MSGIDGFLLYILEILDQLSWSEIKDLTDESRG